MSLTLKEVEAVVDSSSNPCPLCGAIPEIATRDIEPQNDSWYGSKLETFILCSCGLCLFDQYFHEGFGDPQTALAAWNSKTTKL